MILKILHGQDMNMKLIAMNGKLFQSHKLIGFIIKVKERRIYLEIIGLLIFYLQIMMEKR